MAYTNQNTAPQTDADRQKITVDGIASATVKGIKSMFAARQDGADWLWRNPWFTPQQVFDFYGTNAIGICTDDQEAMAFIDRRCLLPDGSDDPALVRYKAMSAVPDTYDLQFEMNGPNNYTGRVLARPKLYVQTIPGATVSISSGSNDVTADDAGMATFVIPEGDHTGTASKDGYDPATFSVSLKRGGQKVTAVPTLITGILTVTGPTGAVVTVTSDAGGDPLTLNLIPDSEGDAQGSNSINLIPNGYTLSSVLEGWRDTPVHINLSREGLTRACGLAE